MPVDINGTTGVTTPGLASAAMPTSGGDLIVESGSNSDGEWTKFADGTQFCSTFLSPTVFGPATSATGNIYISDTHTWPFPAGFSNAAVRTAFKAIKTSGLGVVWTVSGVNADNTITEARNIRFGSATSGDEAAMYGLAFGRWK